MTATAKRGHDSQRLLVAWIVSFTIGATVASGPAPRPAAASTAVDPLGDPLPVGVNPGPPPTDIQLAPSTDNWGEEPTSAQQPAPARQAAAPGQLPIPAVRTVRGQVLNHAGQPVAKAGLFVWGDRSPRLYGGRAWRNAGSSLADIQPDETVVPVLTDEQGRFVLEAQPGKQIAVSCDEVAAWTVEVPETGEMMIRLPLPARIDAILDVAGAPEPSALRVTRTSGKGPHFTTSGVAHSVAFVDGKASLPALPPGTYYVFRNSIPREVPASGYWRPYIDFQFFELAPGEAKVVEWNHALGARVAGSVTGRDDSIGGITIAVISVSPEPNICFEQGWINVYAYAAVDKENKFLTERLAAGRYLLIAEAHRGHPERTFSGMNPVLAAEVTIDVPESGVLTLDPLVLKPWSGETRARAHEPRVEAPAAKPQEPVPVQSAAVTGQVVDHAGQPVAQASVFVLGKNSLRLHGGRAWQRGGLFFEDGKPDETIAPVVTNDEGRFALTVPRGGRIAVSCAELAAWPVEVPATGELLIRLPKPARIEAVLAIEGAPQPSVMQVARVSGTGADFAGISLTRGVTLVDGKAALGDLPPGMYSICRNPVTKENLSRTSMTPNIDWQFLELAEGETKKIAWDKTHGARVAGSVAGQGDSIGEINVFALSVAPEKNAHYERGWTNIYTFVLADKDGKFQTERLAPGRYLLVAEAFDRKEPGPATTGTASPALAAEITIDVPESGVLQVEALVLKPTQGRTRALPGPPPKAESTTR